MGITGRYNFTGIQKAVSVGVNAFLATTAWGAWLLASPFKPVLDALENLAINYLVNRGLIVLNIGAISIDGAIDQNKLDAALTDALTKLQQGRDKITQAQGDAIDNEVREAFDQNADLGATNANDSLVPDVRTPSVRSGRNAPL